MADDSAPPPIPITTLSLRDFLSLATADLNAVGESRHTIEEIIAAAQHYPQIAERINALGLPIFDNPEEAATLLRRELERATQTLPDQVLNEGAQTPTAPEAPEEIAARARLLHAETEKVRTTRSRDERLKELRGSYVSRVMENYLTQSGLSAQQARELAAQAKSQTNPNLSTDAQIREAADKITAVRLTPEQKQRYVHEAKVRAAAETPLMDRELRREAALASTWKTLAANPEARPDVAFAIAENIAVENPSMGSRDVAAAALSHAAMLSAVSGAKTPTNYAAVSSSLYSAYAPGLRGAVGDFLSTIIPKDLRGHIAEYRIAKSIERVGNAIQASGEQIASSPAFNALWEQAKKYEQPKQLNGAGAIAAQVSDIAGYVFGSPDNTARAIFKDGKVTWERIHEAPQGVQLVSVHYAAHAAHMDPFHAAEMGHGFNFLGSIFGSLAKGGIGKLLGGALGSIFGPGGTAAGATVGGGLLEKAWGFLSGALLGQILGGGSGKKYKWIEDGYTPAILVALAVVVILFTPLISPLRFLCLPCHRFEGRNLAFLRGILAAIPSFGASPNIPPTPGLICPVDNGRITQEPGGLFSHLRMDAFDIAATFGSLVRATHNGTIVEKESSYAEGSFALASYGNFVKIKGKDEQGKEFFTVYGHLGKVTGKGVNSVVSQGEPIGTVDNTGFSTGTHLHYELCDVQNCSDSIGQLELPYGCAGNTKPPTGGACAAGNTPTKVMTIGDSITGHYGPVFKTLVEEAFNAVVETNAYYNTNPSDIASAVIPKITGSKPDVVVIYAGTVNVIKNSTEAQIEGVKRMITAARSANTNATIYLVPLQQRADDTIGAVNAFNAALRGLAGGSVRVVSVGAALSGQLFDGIHPNEDGKQTLAGSVRDAISGTLGKCE